MPISVEFPFSDNEALPTIPITLSHAGSSISANALLDTGSTVNLLPYDIGLQLGVIWEEQTVHLGKLQAIFYDLENPYLCFNHAQNDRRNLPKRMHPIH